MRSIGLGSSILVSLLLLTGCGGQADEQARVMAEGEPAGSAKAGMPVAEAAAVAVGPPAAFAQCRSCHSVEPGRSGIGPSLHGIFGKPAGSVPGFNYSTALQQSRIVWDRAALEQWLEAPMRMVPGTRMVVGVRSDEQRREIIEYLEALH